MTAIVENDLELVTVTIADPRTGLDVMYSVPPSVAAALQQLLAAVHTSASHSKPRATWDSACRVVDDDDDYEA